MPRSLRTWFSTAWRTRSASLPGTNTAEFGADACGTLAELAFGAAEETGTGSLDLLQPKPARVATITETTQRRFIWFLLESSQIAIALSTRRTCQSKFQPGAYRLLGFFACFRRYVAHTEFNANLLRKGSRRLATRENPNVIVRNFLPCPVYVEHDGGWLEFDRRRLKSTFALPERMRSAKRVVAPSRLRIKCVGGRCAVVLAAIFVFVSSSVLRIDFKRGYFKGVRTFRNTQSSSQAI